MHSDNVRRGVGEGEGGWKDRSVVSVSDSNEGVDGRMDGESGRDDACAWGELEVLRVLEESIWWMISVGVCALHCDDEGKYKVGIGEDWCDI